MLASALTLARKGMCIFPCRPRDKRPATAHGLKDVTHDLAMIRQWWKAEPACNIGIATGAASKVFAIDIDGLDAEAELRNLEAKHGALPATVEALTARGRHVYFQMPEMPIANSAGKIAPGIDVRGDDGYVLAPPSAAPAPAIEWRDLVANGADEGTRDSSLTRLAGHLLRRHVDPLVVLELLQIWNATRCRPPLAVQDVERICNSIAGRELKRKQNARQHH
jgi:Bifunctional DNA primase/polymerase, N-terminal/Primase C terminal 1 (PriCT-1)